MIAHVAEASERRGRVVLWLDPQANSDPQSFETPVRLAAAYGAELETVVVVPSVAGGEDETGGLPIGHVSEEARLSAPWSGIERFALLARRYRRAVEEAGATHRVRVRHSEGSGDAIDCISGMCLARGPWNIVALARTPALSGHSVISSLLANVGGATGFLMCGPSGAATSPRVVVIAEDAERLPSMLRAAERLSNHGGKVHIVIGAETIADYCDLDAHARLLTADIGGIVFENARPTFGVPGALTEFVARLNPSFIIARFGGAGIADGRELSRTSIATRAPILLVR